MTGGGVINLITKSGTNQFRGTVFEFRRDDALDATGWTNNRNNLEKAPLSYDQFGGSIGGPIWLPTRSGRSPTTGAIARSSSSTTKGSGYDSSVTTLSRVPTELERRGDFSQTFVRTSSGAFVPVQLYDPATTRTNPSGSGFVRERFATPVLPADRLDPVALRGGGLLSGARIARPMIRRVATISSARRSS